MEIAELCQTSKQNISKHIKAILVENELSENSAVNFQLTTAADGKNSKTQIYALPMILAIGYRVRSTRSTQFRQWATHTLAEYVEKGFVLNEDRLKNPPIGVNQADEKALLEFEKFSEIRRLEKEEAGEHYIEALLKLKK
ncbi:hypothetical protein A1D29_01370 [Pasteurellaceae bacterium Orientalotternb1]|nr:hypothetical protein A1D29_01370 [Pasteurellaceae bacterium Orientalotternb1]